MSLSISLGNAITGLSAASRGAEVVSSNVANAMTDGYGKRQVELASRTTGNSGSGVQVVGVSRQVDMRVIADRRIADGQSSNANVLLDFQSRLEDYIGLPGDQGSLATRLSNFEGSLITAASRPDIDARLSDVVQSASSLATKFNDISDGLQTLRQQADAAIARDVAVLNSSLSQMEKVNEEIMRRFATGQDFSTQLDARQVIIDRISEIVPVKEIDRGRGQVALISPGGGVLIDGKAATFEFTQVGVITPDMTRESGSLSGLSINGVPVNLANPTNAIMGGSLAAHFDARDVLAVNEQARIDTLARDLVERFQDPAVDPTLGIGDAGIFTESGSAFTALPPAFEEGLAARISINAVVDPAQGGEPRRIRDGLYSLTPGEIGDATLLHALAGAFDDPRTLGGSGFSDAPKNALGFASEFLSIVGTQRQHFESEASFANASSQSLKELELQGGVDTDHEMQQLLLVETAYNANARVIQTIDELLSRLMEL